MWRHILVCVGVCVCVRVICMAHGATLRDDASTPSTCNEGSYACNPAVVNLRAYLRKATAMHPDVNYDESIDFLKNQAETIGLPYNITEVAPDRPVMVITWEGSQPELPNILLNSHMDVVPVYEIRIANSNTTVTNSWIHPPFEAFMDENGTIYARGIQDMKSVGIQYLEAVRRLKASGVQPKRTVHLSFVPDEEIGGTTGMYAFVNRTEFTELNVGFALDEGMASETDDYLVFFAERVGWLEYLFLIITDIVVHCRGKSGHGSLLHNNTAAEKIQYMINKLLGLREEYKKKLESNPDLSIGDVTTINLTILKGDIQSNVVPEEFTADFDIRLSLDVNQDDFLAMIQRWCEEAGEGVTLELLQKKVATAAPTKLDNSNPYWMAFEAAAQQLKISIKKQVFPASTDSRYISEKGTLTMGFSPMINTPVQLHEDNESLNAGVFLKGIELYEAFIPALANA